MKLCKFLKESRLNQALSQEDAAAAIGISKCYYCNIETGKRVPGIIAVRKIAAYYKLDASVIRQLSREEK